MMRRLLVGILVVTAIMLAGSGRPAGADDRVEVARQALAISDLGELFEILDADGEPCSAVPNSIPGIFDFSPACAAHDRCYVRGGENSACDSQFLTDMLALCAAQHPQALDPTRYLCQAFALLYYGGVVIFGLLT
ncbi:MAG: hypothetical protein ACRD2W_18935 [Acidimicrobiales bacterium]